MLTITDQQMTFDMCSAISKHYAWVVHPTILQDLVRRHRKDHVVIFNFWDGENVFLSGALELIKETQHIFNIPKEKILIRSYFDIDVDFATCERNKLNGFMHLALAYLQTINNDSFDKKFLSLSGRIDIFRLRLAKYLHTNWIDDTILSFKPDILSAQHYFKNNVNLFYQDEIKWVEQYAPINFDAIQNRWPSGSIDFNESLLSSATYYHRYFLEIVTETDSKNPYWITEKTLRPLVFGKPFILFSGPYALQHLRDLGFQTFSPWINESYDLIENQFDRFDAIINEIDRIAAMSYDQLKHMAVEINDILVYNQETLAKKY
jgi:hypothetical protein